MPTDLTLVTGGGGFLGRHVVQTLVAHGHAVRVLDVQQPVPELAGDWIVGSVADAHTVRSALFRACPVLSTWRRYPISGAVTVPVS